MSIIDAGCTSSHWIQFCNILLQLVALICDMVDYFQPRRRGLVKTHKCGLERNAPIYNPGTSNKRETHLQRDIQDQESERE